MDNPTILSLASMFLTLVSVSTAFLLQLERRKIKKMEKQTTKYKRRLAKTLDMLEGYQQIEVSLAAKEDLDISIFRRQIREKENVKHITFLIPSKLKEYKDDLLV